MVFSHPNFCVVVFCNGPFLLRRLQLTDEIMTLISDGYNHYDLERCINNT